jgi:ribosomal-protein-alanine N-acetyltransferase
VKILESNRLFFRYLLREDLDSLYALYRNPEIRRYFPDGTLTYEQTKQERDWFLRGHPNHPELGLWATIHKDTQQFIGRCGLLPWTIDLLDRSGERSVARCRPQNWNAVRKGYRR